MGIESYFFNLILPDTDYDSVRRLLVDNCSIRPYSELKRRIFNHKVQDDRFSIDGKIVVDMHGFDASKSISLILSFCNYERNIVYAYNMCKKLACGSNESILRVLNDAYGFDNMSMEVFRDVIDNNYKNKRHEFENRYGYIEEDMLPCEFWKRKRSIFNNICK